MWWVYVTDVKLVRRTQNWGWACESVISMEVVTADGQHLLINKDSYPDLFWAARGAGPGFPAIVTRFYLLTRPLLEMYQSLYFYPVSLFKKVLQWEINVCYPPLPLPHVTSLPVVSSTHIPRPDRTNLRPRHGNSLRLFPPAHLLQPMQPQRLRLRPRTHHPRLLHPLHHLPLLRPRRPATHPRPPPARHQTPDLLPTYFPHAGVHPAVVDQPVRAKVLL